MEARKSNRKYYRLFLSNKDEYVPDTFVSITEIFTNPKMRLPGYTAEEWILGEKRLKELREKTFYEVKKRFTESEGKQYDVYWNANLDAINYLGLNEFAKLSFFIELAQVMVCFQTEVETKYMKGSKRRYVSFGIRKKNYRAYYNYLKATIEKDETATTIKLYEPKKSNRGSLARINYKGTNILVESPDGTKTRIPIIQNDIYNEFVKWCDLKGIEKKRALYGAMKLLMKTYPVDDPETIKTDRHKTDIEIVHEAAKKQNRVGFTHITANVSPEMGKDIEDIIERFNNDPDNLVKPQLSKGVFALQALYFYIKHLPLKYTNPLLLEEYNKIKESEEYNNQFV